MKKLIALILVTLFMLSLVACGGNNSNNTDGNNSIIDDNNNNVNNDNNDNDKVDNNRSGASSPEKAVKSYFQSTADLDLETYKSVALYYNKDLILKYTDKTGSELNKLIEELDYCMESLDSLDIDSKNKTKIKFNYVEKGNAGESYESTFEAFGIASAVEDFVWVDFSITITEDDEPKDLTNDMPCVKLGGRWYVVTK